MNRLTLEIYKFLSRCDECLDDDMISDPDSLSEHVRNAVLRANDISASKLFDTIFDYGFLNIDWECICSQLKKDRQDDESEEDEEEDHDEEELSEGGSASPSLASKLVDMLSREHS